jgi:hypothetical protein
MPRRPASPNLPPATSLLRYIITSLLRLPKSYAARVALTREARVAAGRSVPESDVSAVPAPESIFCRTRRIDNPNHPRGGIASHPGRGCRIFSRSRNASSTNEIVANSSSKLISELGSRCTAWSRIQVNSRIIPTITSMEFPITPAPAFERSARFATHCEVGGLHFNRSRRNSPSCRALQRPLLGWDLRRVTLGETPKV